MTHKGFMIAFATTIAAGLSTVPCWAADTAVRTLPRGTILTASDISSGSPDLLGMEVTRSVRKGSLLDRAFLREPHIVKRNERVAIVFVHGRLRLETTGRSLEGGALGDRVTIMNTDSRQKVVGYISGPGRVEVKP